MARDEVKLVLTASAGAGRMHIGPLSRGRRVWDGFFANVNAHTLMCAGQVVIGNLPVVANVKIALSVQSKKPDKLAYE